MGSRLLSPSQASDCPLALIANEVAGIIDRYFAVQFNPLDAADAPARLFTIATHFTGGKQFVRRGKLVKFWSTATVAMQITGNHTHAAVALSSMGYKIKETSLIISKSSSSSEGALWRFLRIYPGQEHGSPAATAGWGERVDTLRCVRRVGAYSSRVEH